MTDESVRDLLTGAADGDRAAWDTLVDRFGRLVWSIIRSFRLDPATAADVNQTVWLRLVENLGRIRRAEALPGWLATTARREALRVISDRQRYVPTVAIEVMEDPDLTDPSADLIEGERSRDLVIAFRKLSDQCRQLLRLLTAEPRLEYAEVAGVIGRPVGSIGPTRQRCLDALRNRLAGLAGRESATEVQP